MEEEVVLVNERDDEIGSMPKLLAHKRGALHRAVSVFIINSKGDLLLQQRAPQKYHSPGLWTNTCCSHPRVGERAHAAALRRQEEEMGLQAELKHCFAFIYRAEFPNGLVEHELDHVFLGVSDVTPRPDPTEASDWRYASVDQVTEELQTEPDRFTPWFPLAFNGLLDRDFLSSGKSASA